MAAKTNREREHAAREAKLEDMRELVSSGVLVIRSMTKAERAKWAKRRAKLDRDSTPNERVRREAALRSLRRRVERVASRHT
jgi:hypothetical protein